MKLILSTSAIKRTVQAQIAATKSFPQTAALIRKLSVKIKMLKKQALKTYLKRKKTDAVKEAQRHAAHKPAATHPAKPTTHVTHPAKPASHSSATIVMSAEMQDRMLDEQIKMSDADLAECCADFDSESALTKDTASEKALKAVAQKLNKKAFAIELTKQAVISFLSQNGAKNITHRSRNWTYDGSLGDYQDGSFDLNGEKFYYCFSSEFGSPLYVSHKEIKNTDGHIESFNSESATPIVQTKGEKKKESVHLNKTLKANPKALLHKKQMSAAMRIRENKALRLQIKKLLEMKKKLQDKAWGLYVAKVSKKASLKPKTDKPSVKTDKPSVKKDKVLPTDKRTVKKPAKWIFDRASWQDEAKKRGYKIEDYAHGDSSLIAVDSKGDQVGLFITKQDRADGPVGTFEH